MPILKLHHGSQQAELDSWIAAMAGGDTSALEHIYHSASSAVYAFALSLLKNSHDAEDVLHDCFINIYAAASTYRSNRKPMAWILTIARNLCLKILRDRQKVTQLDTEDWHSYMESCSDMTADDKVVLEQCMQLLSDDERQIVVLHAVAGFKHREIAELLDLALPTVLSKYHRAIKKLRAYL